MYLRNYRGHFWANSYRYIFKFNRKVSIIIKIFLTLFKTSQFWNIWKLSHSPHLNGHSPHVASGEWVGHDKSTIFLIHIHLKTEMNSYNYTNAIPLRQWFLTFFAPRTPTSQKNFHGPLNYQSALQVDPEYM